ncbi:MAG: 6-bladed beta-propeller [Tannerella sp.]|jgi:hypothetical protein|nr:6-bladed beta-propeller [Tannerella sp.]
MKRTTITLLKIGLLACISLFGCRKESRDKPDGLAVIDIINNLGKYQTIPVSEFVSELEYIPLETDLECLIGENIRDLIVTTTHIFIVSDNYCYAFGRDGKFLNRIGRIGNGPGEYQVIGNLSVDEQNKTLFFENFRNVFEYSWDGVFQKSIPIPENTNKSPLGDVSFVRNNLFIGHNHNHVGNEPYNFLLFDTLGQVVKSFENHVKINHTKPSYFIAERAIKPFRMSESIFVKENSNDTLYYLNKYNEMIAGYIFDLGNFGYSIQKRLNANQRDYKETIKGGLIHIPNYNMPIVGTPRYLFFSFTAEEVPKNIPFPAKRVRIPVIPPGFKVTGRIDSHSVVGIYFFENQITRLLDADHISLIPGLMNDVDGGLSFWPRYYSSDNELIDIWQSYDMKEFLTDKYFASHEIKNPQAHKKLKELLNKISAADNPVVVIGKMK